jgi:hypothetical protein
MAMPWHDLDPSMARSLVDARLQLHHAAQLATAVGISYLPKKPDDSHTNLEWLYSAAALASRVVPTSTSFRVAVRPQPLSLLLLDAANGLLASLPLHGQTIQAAAGWLREQLPTVHADATRLTLNRHYTIPRHTVDDGAPFDATDDRAFRELARWYEDAALVLEELRRRTRGASEVRCWPHHFDIATLIEVEPARGSDYARTVGVGLGPGDDYYAEPYVYVNMNPAPTATRTTPALDGGGTWHTEEWIGAVLPGSRLGRTNQREQVDNFLRSAVRECTQMVRTLADEFDRNLTRRD